MAQPSPESEAPQEQRIHIARAAPTEAAPQSAMEALLSLEAEARRAGSARELTYLIANDTRRLVPARQTFVILHAGKVAQAAAISSLASVDRTVPLVRWMERQARSFAKPPASAAAAVHALPEARVTNVGALASKADQDEIKGYPFPELLFLPLCARDGSFFASLILARETAWGERDLIVAKRLAETYAHAWVALSATRPRHTRNLWVRNAPLAGALLAFCAMFLPVPLTTLAPVEVTARDPVVIAAPIDGVIERVGIEPNTRIREGQELFHFLDTTLRNKLEVSEQSVQVALAKSRRAEQGAFSDSTARREIAIANAELKLAEAERDYARSLLDKTIVRATRSGLAVFANKKDWEGRPVQTGERIMEIADPASVELWIELPVKDAIVVREGARVKVFLDSDPLNPREAVLTSASFHASPTATNTLAYVLRARLNDGEGLAPRIGYRGSAQVYGETTWLGFYLFRKPFAAFRQLAGL